MDELIACGASPDCVHAACKTCGRPIRKPRTTVKDHPGSVMGIEKIGECRTCIRRATAPPPPPVKLRKCIDCKRLMRPGSRSIDEFPGTVQHNARGRCVTCAWHSRKAAQRAARRQPDTGPPLDAKQADLRAFGVWKPEASHFWPLSDATLQAIGKIDRGFVRYIEKRRKQTPTKPSVPAEGWQYYIKDKG